MEEGHDGGEKARDGRVEHSARGTEKRSDRMDTSTADHSVPVCIGTVTRSHSVALCSLSSQAGNFSFPIECKSCRIHLSSFVLLSHFKGKTSERDNTFTTVFFVQ